MKGTDVKEERLQDGRFIYYSTQRPVCLGTFPKARFEPEEIVNFDDRRHVREDHCNAYGYLVYPHPLTEKEQSDYELVPCWKNDDISQGIELAIAAVGKLEDAHDLRDDARLTVFDEGKGSYVCKDYVPLERLMERYFFASERG